MKDTHISVGNAPCSWGVIENVAGERGGYAQVLDEMQQTGFSGTELGDWGFMPTDPDVLRKALAARNLQLLASWVTVYLHDPSRLAESEAAAVRTARLLAEVGGPDVLIVLGNDPYTDPMRTKNAGRIKPEQGMSEEQWQSFAAGANQIARAVRRETALRTVFHHHIGTWVETPEETAKFLSLTDPDVIGLCFDTGHYRFGGVIPSQGCAAMPTATGMSTSKITIHGSPNSPVATNGMPSSPSNTACSASWARAMSISRRSYRR
jgi:inosose dehydratase